MQIILTAAVERASANHYFGVIGGTEDSLTCTTKDNVTHSLSSGQGRMIFASPANWQSGFGHMRDAIGKELDQ